MSNSIISDSIPQAPRVLLGEQQLREHARMLARTCPLLATPGPDRLLEGLADDEKRLDAAFVKARATAADKRSLEPAAEWLVDNFYVIKEQIKEIRTGLPKPYRRQLPTVQAAHAQATPRILRLMSELVQHVDGNVREHVVHDFVDAFQQETHLTIGELWAIPLMLRLALVKQLRPVAESIVRRIDDTESAARWARRLLETARSAPAEVVQTVAEMSQQRTDLSAAWVAEFQRRTQGRHPALAMAVLWVEQRVAAGHLDVATVLESESRAQAMAQVSISNCISSLRMIGRADWSALVESVGAVDAQLRADPAGVYADMDFATRDHYRHVLELIARRAKLPEWELAQRVVKMAADASAVDGDARRRHVGYWLVGAGRNDLERRLGVRRPFVERLTWLLRRYPTFFHVAPVVLLTFAIALVGVPAMKDFSPWHMVLVIVALVIAASHLSVAVVNWVITLSVAPETLSRLSLEHGIPDSLRSLVAVPCLLTSAEEIEGLVAALEIRYLANRDANLYFALLSDFVDASTRELPTDQALLEVARQRIEALNRVHEPHGPPRFCLLHRERRWNPASKMWMGRERKRGKLGDLNRLLRCRGTPDMQIVVGNVATLRTVKYVIVVDADTQLPPQSALQLVATMAHPLNLPHLDRSKHRVVEGYAILQPRISVGAARETASAFARLFSDEIGLDPYTRVVSDVYHDLFGEASYVGKGIYDVDAFMRAAGTRFPDNLILSHDLLEGSYARTGLVSDVEFFEDHPDSYSSEVRRRHRWIRGDWQIAQWLLPWVPGPRRGLVRNALTTHQRWKILDNLRRSLVPAALLVVLVNGWWLALRPLYWTVVVLGVLFASTLLISLQHFLTRNPRMEWDLHLRLNWEALVRRLLQTALQIAMLPFEALNNLDAIVRSLWRALISGRRLLQWVPASELARTSARGVGAYYRMMWTAPVIAVGLVYVLALRPILPLMLAAPFLVTWMLSPLIAWRLSVPRKVRRRTELTPRQRDFLGVTARRTWAFFETWVNAENNWLPPDNVQEYPHEQVAHRTSPTNIGMYLTATLSAWDFGYIAVEELLARITTTLATLNRLPQHRGHFLNWYDTRTLDILRPAYVSTVDSGNLIGCLIVLARGLDGLGEERVLPGHAWRGLRDAWNAWREDVRVRPSRAVDQNSDLIAAIELALAEPPASRSALSAQFVALQRVTMRVERLASAISASEDIEAVVGLRRVERQCRAWLTHLDEHAPWLAVCEGVAADVKFGDALETQLERLDRNPSLRRTDVIAQAALTALGEDDVRDSEAGKALAGALCALVACLATRGSEVTQLALRCRALSDMDFDFLWLPRQHLLTIGYNVEEDKADASAYDLLASEARLASFIAIAQGKLPRDHWFALGRLLTVAAGRPTLVSWSGSMFEYLMPLLLMPSFENTLLTRSCRTAVDRQIEYGRERGVPWGISESAYNMTDTHLVYQYRAFGVPGLGLKRGLGEDLVIAPYASVMALLLRPGASSHNLQELADLGATGRYGFYEALDYTPARLPENADFVIVRAFMAHHQGMAFLALSSVLNGRPMQRRFLREPMFQANQLLLQEKVPAVLSVDANTLRAQEPQVPTRDAESPSRVIAQMGTSVPQLQLLSNGRYHTAISQAGGGFSQWNDIAVNHWSSDATCDANGIFCYVQDLDGGQLWSNALQPTRVDSPDLQAIFGQASAEFRRRDHGIETHTRIAVSSEDDIELRRVVVTNRSAHRRRLALTSYVELVLTRRSDAQAHPVFNKLFVETEYSDAQQTILARRRPRADDETPPWFVHLMAVRGAAWGKASFETRRDVFIGRGHTPAAPGALRSGDPLAGGFGAVLDPVAALRREVLLEPGKSATVDIITGIATTRDEALVLAERYAFRHLDARVFELAWTRDQVIRHQLELRPADTQLFCRLASSVVYADPQLRRRERASGGFAGGQSGLWKYGISGDLPIVLVRISESAELDLVREALRAHLYWQMHGLRADLVIWNDDASGYRQELQDQIMGMLGSSVEAQSVDRPGGVFVRRTEHIGSEDRNLLLASAQVVLDGGHGSMAEQLPRASATPAPLAQVSPRTPKADERALKAPGDLQMFNGTGGYSADGDEYVIWLPAGHVTPLPWVNVLANPDFGSVVSEAGGAYTWFENAHESRLTPWYNDAITDDSGEAFYLRDETSGERWSPAPWPMRGGGAYRVRHGFGYSVFETVQSGIASELTQFVAVRESLKFSVLKLRNDSGVARKLSVAAYVEWVLGDHRERSAPHVETSRPVGPRVGAESGIVTAGSRVILASNAWNENFGRRIALFATSAGEASATGDRSAFIGRNRNLRAPRAMQRTSLEPDFGIGLDPCAAWLAPVDLGPGEEIEVVFVLGVANDAREATALATTYANPPAAAAELAAVRERWRELLGRLIVRTPDAATNLLANGWLTYQVVACRLWARSGFYQSGGAFGFRDQLQDVLSLLAIEPAIAREQILLNASRQFSKGDVQHWWHPPLGRGVRTHFSDDFLWLPWVTAHYVQVTGDTALLDERVPFLEGRTLDANEESYYDIAEVSVSSESIYEHCARALRHGLRFGSHGLPLIGAGDWNDGMNRLGRLGRGESVWLAFFLIDALNRFAPIASARGDAQLVELCRSEAAGLARHIEQNGWDGAWYRRAYNDDGVPIGSAENEECRIDSLPQSWAQLTRVGDPARRKQALDSALDHLVHKDERVIQLFDPPFDTSHIDPGYIKGYIPGTRENGGQYTHAAIWLAMACGAVGRTDRAWELLDIMNPINHARDADGVDTYKVEPYVVAADVYWAKGHRGRGGWSWYTGAAGWMQQLITRSLLGLNLDNGRLRLQPCIPTDWDGYGIDYRWGDARYAIEAIRVGEGNTVVSVEVDGEMQDDVDFALNDDGREHVVRVMFGGI